MRNANHHLTPEERSCDQLYSSAPGGIHQPCNTDYTNLDYEGYLCEVHKQAWATPEEEKVLLLGMCEISTPWKKPTCSFEEALAFALRLEIFSLSCRQSTSEQVEQNGKCKHSCTLDSENLDDTCDKCKPSEKIICFTPDVKPRFQHLGSDQNIVMDVESLCEEASKNAGFSDGRVQGIRTGLCEQIALKTGQVVVVLEPYSKKIGQKIKINRVVSKYALSRSAWQRETHGRKRLQHATNCSIKTASHFHYLASKYCFGR